MDGTRFSCLTNAQQQEYDNLSPKHKEYIVLRSQGYSQKDAYAQAYGTQVKNPKNCGNKLEAQHPSFKTLIEAFRNYRNTKEVFLEGSEISTIIDEKVKAGEEQLELERVSALAPIDGNILPDLTDANLEQARNIQFLRNVANGTICTKKIVKTYDEKGRLTGSREEINQDVKVQMEAREKLNRYLGLREVIQIEDVKKCKNIVINIVNASLKGEDKPQEDKVFAEGEVVTDADSGEEFIKVEPVLRKTI